MRGIFAGLITVVLTAPAYAASCGMEFAFNQSDNDGKSRVAVWEGASDAPLFFSTGLHINTDGTKRSYKVSDFWGEDDALNNLCNAMTDRCRGPKGESAKDKEKRLRERRIVTQRAASKEWRSDLLKQTKIGRKIIAFEKGKPCKDVDGFLVNATALQDPTVPGTCDFAKYVDSLRVSAIVLPGRLSETPNVPTGFQKRNAEVGDLAVVMSSRGDVVTFAVVGDMGPARELGEGTLALARSLLKKRATR